MLNKIKLALSNGYSAIPWIDVEGNFTPRKFKTNRYNVNHAAWSDYSHNIFSIHLKDCILIDIDGNKGDADIQKLLSEVCEFLNIDEFDMDMAAFQNNSEGDSLHYLFRCPAGVDTKDYQQSNDGRAITRVDFKTGNQLVHIKAGKTVSWAKKDDLPELTVAQFSSIFSKSSRSDIDDDDGLMAAISAQPNSDIDDNDVLKTLAKIDPTVLGYDEWFKVGLGISHQYMNSDKGKDIFKEFSKRTGDNYDENEIDSKWATFKDDTRTDRVTFRTVMHMIQTNERTVLKKALAHDEYRRRAQEITSYVSVNLLNETGFEVDIDTDTIQLMLRGSFWNGIQGRINMTNNNDDLVIFPETKTSKMLVTRFGQPMLNMHEFIAHLESLELKVSDVKRLKSSLMDEVGSSIQFNSQADTVTYAVDMFTERTYFDVKSNHATINFKYDPLTLGTKHYRVECDESVNAYKRHFPECDELLSMIVGSRFASSRKKAYVWLKCPSDWGKDVFRGALGAFHFEMSVSEVEKALEGAPVGKSPRSMFRSFVMVTNEFKKVKSELKQLEDDITVAAKYQLETIVPLYTKLFMSAESVDSLIGEYGVEAQFANRFSMIEGKGELSELPEFKKFGNTHFVNAVTTYIVDFINTTVEEYRTLGLEAATRKGDVVLGAFHKTHGLRTNNKTIDESIIEIADSVREAICKTYAQDAPIMGEILYLTSAKSRIQNIIRDSDMFTISERTTIAHKVDAIIKLLSVDGHGSKSRNVNGSSVRSLDIKFTPAFNF